MVAVGGLALLILFVLLDTTHPYGRAASYKGYGPQMLEQLAQCDWLGIVFLLAWGASFILSLQWGGIEKSWNSGSVIALLVMTVVLTVTFVAWELHMGSHALLPLKLIMRRNIA